MVSYYYVRGYVAYRGLNWWVPTIGTILPIELWRYIFDLVRSLELSQTSNDDVTEQDQTGEELIVPQQIATEGAALIPLCGLTSASDLVAKTA